jgi:large subunit ribosomal protein L18
MASIRTQKKRRRQGKTDYKNRLSLLKANKPRIVIRGTNKYFILQAIESVEAQDRVVKTITSKDLIKLGWDAKFKGSLKSLPAGYLTGILASKDLKGPGYIVDLGMARTTSGNRIFAVLKGLVDGGVKISANEKVFPSDERVKGQHLKEEVQQVITKVMEKLK